MEHVTDGDRRVNGAMSAADPSIRDLSEPQVVAPTGWPRVGVLPSISSGLGMGEKQAQIMGKLMGYVRMK